MKINYYKINKIINIMKDNGFSLKYKNLVIKLDKLIQKSFSFENNGSDKIYYLNLVHNSLDTIFYFENYNETPEFIRTLFIERFNLKPFLDIFEKIKDEDFNLFMEVPRIFINIENGKINFDDKIRIKIALKNNKSFETYIIQTISEQFDFESFFEAFLKVLIHSKKFNKKIDIDSYENLILEEKIYKYNSDLNIQKIINY